MRSLSFAFTLVLFLGCREAGPPPVVRVSDAYVRETPPGATTTAAFMTLESNVATRVVAAKGTAAKAVELHNHLHEGGMMTMREVEAIELPAGQPVALEPGGFHVMLIGLKALVQAGETVELTLVLDGGTTVPVAATVRSLRRTASPHPVPASAPSSTPRSTPASAPSSAPASRPKAH